MTTQSTPTDAVDSLTAAFAGLVATGDVEPVERLLRPDFVHHRPDATTSTKEQWLAAVRSSLERIGGMEVEVEHVLATDEHVVMHTRRRLPDGPEITVVDICRFEDGMIAEIWEIIEPAAEAAAHLSWWDA
ncbi:nuclear transport factor 2 family protein [Nocardioides sp. NPDC101246]|uniref:nuclear transport factor 2 family protein n=1 Tax=Nocardioides sp. NPDC101246 TaxID=3364336 RepID=UPI00382E7555